MTDKEFEKRLKAAAITKMTGEFDRGYSVQFATAEGGGAINIFLAHDQRGKRDYARAYNRLLEALANKWGYKGSLIKWCK